MKPNTPDISASTPTLAQFEAYKGLRFPKKIKASQKAVILGIAACEQAFLNQKKSANS
jgi:hypothetical protein